MDNEEDYMELCKLLAKLKFNLVIYCFDNNEELAQSYREEISKIDKFLCDIPILIKGG